MRQRLALLAILAVVAACDGLNSPTQSDTAGPASLVGTYQAGDFWKASVVSGVVTLYTRSCPGQVVVESQSDGDWSGRFASEAPCPVESGAVHGTVDSGGRVTMLFDGVSIGDTPYSSGPCPEIKIDLSGAPVLTGKLKQGGVLELAIETTAKCLDPEVSAKLKLEAKGTRQP